MRKISILLTILVTSFVMTLAGLVASPIAAASENDGSISATFPSGSSVLTKDQKAAIKKALASSGTDATFIVTGTAGKLPGVNDRWVQRLAKKRAQAIKAYLVSLGVSKTSITTQSSTTEIGVAPKSMGSYPAPAATPTPTAAATSTTTTTPTAPTTCATGTTCIVGDRGPGGGIVFYVSAANFTSAGSACSPACKYLEVAPSTWQIAGAFTPDNASSYVWSSDISVVTTQVTSAVSTAESGFTGEQENWKIGQGFNNTRLIRDTSSAKVAVRAYAGTGTSTLGQWFIPSMNELNELCKYAWGLTTGVLTASCSSSGTLKTGLTDDLGGFVSGVYWSSSEKDLVATHASYQQFAWFSQASAYKNTAGTIRPIRAFAPAM